MGKRTESDLLKMQMPIQQVFWNDLNPLLERRCPTSHGDWAVDWIISGCVEERMFMFTLFPGCEPSRGSAFLTQSMTKGMWTIWTKPLVTMPLHTERKEAFHSPARTLISICSGGVNHHFHHYQMCSVAFFTLTGVAPSVPDELLVLKSIPTGVNQLVTHMQSNMVSFKFLMLILFIPRHCWILRSDWSKSDSPITLQFCKIITDYQFVLTRYRFCSNG